MAKKSLGKVVLTHEQLKIKAALIAGDRGDCISDIEKDIFPNLNDGIAEYIDKLSIENLKKYIELHDDDDYDDDNDDDDDDDDY